MFTPTSPDEHYSTTSMTGFATTTASIMHAGNAINLTITLKTLNARYLEASCKFPFALTHLETECLKRFKKRLVRGNIYCTVHVSNLAALKASILPAAEVVEGYKKAVHLLKEKHGIQGSFEIRDLLQLPHVFEMPEEILDEAASTQILALLDTTLDQLIVVRTKEGKALADDIASRAHIMQHAMQQLSERAKVVHEQKRTQLMTSMEPFMLAATPETKELQMQQVYNQLEKMDVHEEIVRFQAHLVSLHECLRANELEKGKRLDFLLQELFREISTTMAKAAEPEITKLGISIKIELEKAREQVQNIV
jgi:uncharacterized protein (TIGR00255 family)